MRDFRSELRGREARLRQRLPRQIQRERRESERERERERRESERERERREKRESGEREREKEERREQKQRERRERAGEAADAPRLAVRLGLLELYRISRRLAQDRRERHEGTAKGTRDASGPEPKAASEKVAQLLLEVLRCPPSACWSSCLDFGPSFCLCLPRGFPLGALQNALLGLRSAPGLGSRCGCAPCAATEGLKDSHSRNYTDDNHNNNNNNNSNNNNHTKVIIKITIVIIVMIRIIMII